MDWNSIIVRYGEIALKGKNRIDFETRLKRNIKRFLESQSLPPSTVIRSRSRIYIRGIFQVPDLKKVLGIHSYSPAREIAKDYELLKKEARSFSPTLAAGSSFSIRCQRVDKKFPITSIQVEKEIGRIIQQETGLAVDLTHPDQTLNIEIGTSRIYLFGEKIPAYGGLPFGTAGKLVSLISGGIDSPVATFLMMKRGVEPVLLHFHFSDSLTAKVQRIKKKLEEYTSGQKLRLIVIPRDGLFSGKLPELNEGRYQSYICVLCKYLMHKKASTIAQAENAAGIITGDNLAQVASQTLKNLYAQRSASSFPIYSPLIGFDKVDTINLAKEIGTFDLSILPGQGCQAPSNPKTGVSFERLSRILSETGLK